MDLNVCGDPGNSLYESREPQWSASRMLLTPAVDWLTSARRCLLTDLCASPPILYHTITETQFEVWNSWDRQKLCTVKTSSAEVGIQELKCGTIGFPGKTFEHRQAENQAVSPVPGKILISTVILTAWEQPVPSHSPTRRTVKLPSLALELKIRPIFLEIYALA